MINKENVLEIGKGVQITVLFYNNSGDKDKIVFFQIYLVHGKNKVNRKLGKLK